MAIMSVSLYLTFANGIAINRKAQRLEDFYREARWTLDTMTRELENVTNYKYQDFYQNRQGGFQGDLRSLVLISPTDSGIRWVRYSLRDREEVKIHQVLVGTHTKGNTEVTITQEQRPAIRWLVREEGPVSNLFHSDNPKIDNVEILSRHIPEEGLKFSYAFKDSSREDSEMTWRDQWHLPHHPVGIRVEMTFIDPQGEAAPLNIKKDILIPTGYWGHEESGLSQPSDIQ